jgi:hypothetical protein
MNKETLEEASKRIYPDKTTPGWLDHWSATERRCFIEGAKWQQERYSKMGLVDIMCGSIDYEINQYAIEQFKKK